MLHGFTTPAGTDPANKSTILSWLRSLWQIVPVAGTTARAQLLSDIATWFTPSTSNPVMVYRADAAAYAKVEIYNGSAWSGLIQGDTGWVAATLDAAWDTYSNVASRKVGPIVHVKALVRPDSGTVSASATTGLIATIPSGHRPDADQYIPCTQWVSGGTPEYRADATVEIKTNGEVRLVNGASSAASGAYITVTYSVD